MQLSSAQQQLPGAKVCYQCGYGAITSEITKLMAGKTAKGCKNNIPRPCRDYGTVTRDNGMLTRDNGMLTCDHGSVYEGNNTATTERITRNDATTERVTTHATTITERKKQLTKESGKNTERNDATTERVTKGTITEHRSRRNDSGTCNEVRENAITERKNSL